MQIQSFIYALLVSSILSAPTVLGELENAAKASLQPLTKAQEDLDLQAAIELSRTTVGTRHANVDPSGAGPSNSHAFDTTASQLPIHDESHLSSDGVTPFGNLNNEPPASAHIPANENPTAAEVAGGPAQDHEPAQDPAAKVPVVDGMSKDTKIAVATGVGLGTVAVGGLTVAALLPHSQNPTAPTQ